MTRNRRWRRLQSAFFVNLLLALTVAGCAPSQSSSSEDVRQDQYPLITEQAIYENPLSDTSIRSLDWNPTGDSIAIGGRLEAYIYDLDIGDLSEIKQVLGFSPQVAWNSTGTLLAGGDSTLWVWDLDRQEFIMDAPAGGSFPHFGRLFWHPEDEAIATTLFLDVDKSSIVLADIVGQRVNILPFEDWEKPAEVLAWNPNGLYLIASERSRKSLALMDIETLEILDTYTPNPHTGTPVDWNPKKSEIVFQDTRNTLIVWNMTTGQEVNRLATYSDEVYELRWDPEGVQVAIAGESGVWLWHTSSGITSLVQSERGLAVDWSPDGAQLVTHVNSVVRIYDVSD